MYISAGDINEISKRNHYVFVMYVNQSFVLSSQILIFVLEKTNLALLLDKYPDEYRDRKKCNVFLTSLIPMASRVFATFSTKEKKDST